MNHHVAVAYLDVDDVLLDFRRMILESYVTDRISKDPVDLDNYVAREMSYSELVTPDTFSSYMSRNRFRNLKAIPGAAEFTNHLKAKNVKVVLITSLDPRYGTNRILDLHEAGIYYDEMYFTLGGNKGEYVQALNKRHGVGPNLPAVFVDDMAKQCLRVAEFDREKRVTPVTIDFPYNQKDFEAMDRHQFHAIEILPYFGGNFQITYANLFQEVLFILQRQLDELKEKHATTAA